MSELGWEHADFGISGGAGLVAARVIIDVLDADDAVPILIDFDELDFAGRFATEAIVERSGGGKSGGFAEDCSN